MYKIFVHEICKIIGNGHDRDKEFYSTIQKKTRIYCNCQDCFDNIRFWKVLDELKSIVCSAQETYDHYGYIGDYDKNRCREDVNYKLANYICDKLNNACDKKCLNNIVWAVINAHRFERGIQITTGLPGIQNVAMTLLMFS